MIDGMTMVGELLLNTLALARMNYVLSQFPYNTLRKPMVFGPYLTSATWGSPPLNMMSVLSDSEGQSDHVPNHWRKLDDDEVFQRTQSHRLAIAAMPGGYVSIPRKGESIVQTGFYEVPDVLDTLVRLYHCKEPLTPKQLACAQVTSCAQAAYSRSTLEFTDAFWDALKLQIVTFERRDVLISLAAEQVREEAEHLARSLDWELDARHTISQLIRETN